MTSIYQQRKEEEEKRSFLFFFFRLFYFPTGFFFPVTSRSVVGVVGFNPQESDMICDTVTLNRHLPPTRKKKITLGGARTDTKKEEPRTWLLNFTRQWTRRQPFARLGCPAGPLLHFEKNFLSRDEHTIRSSTEVVVDSVLFFDEGFLFVFRLALE